MSIKAMKLALATFEKIYEGCGNVIEDRINKDVTSLAKCVREDCIKGMDAIKTVLREKNRGTRS